MIGSSFVDGSSYCFVVIVLEAEGSGLRRSSAWLAMDIITLLVLRRKSDDGFIETQVIHGASSHSEHDVLECSATAFMSSSSIW